MRQIAHSCYRMLPALSSRTKARGGLIACFFIASIPGSNGLQLFTIKRAGKENALPCHKLSYWPIQCLPREFLTKIVFLQFQACRHARISSKKRAFGERINRNLLPSGSLTFEDKANISVPSVRSITRLLLSRLGPYLASVKNLFNNVIKWNKYNLTEAVRIYKHNKELCEET